MLITPLLMKFHLLSLRSPSRRRTQPPVRVRDAGVRVLQDGRGAPQRRTHAPLLVPVLVRYFYSPLSTPSSFIHPAPVESTARTACLASSRVRPPPIISLLRPNARPFPFFPMLSEMHNSPLDSMIFRDTLMPPLVLSPFNLLLATMMFLCFIFFMCISRQARKFIGNHSADFYV